MQARDGIKLSPLSGDRRCSPFGKPTQRRRHWYVRPSLSPASLGCSQSLSTMRARLGGSKLCPAQAWSSAFLRPGLVHVGRRLKGGALPTVSGRDRTSAFVLFAIMVAIPFVASVYPMPTLGFVQLCQPACDGLSHLVGVEDERRFVGLGTSASAAHRATRAAVSCTDRWRGAAGWLVISDGAQRGRWVLRLRALLPLVLHPRIELPRLHTDDVIANELGTFAW